jgi:hypothetical protein
MNSENKTFILRPRNIKAPSLTQVATRVEELSCMENPQRFNTSGKPHSGKSATGIQKHLACGNATSIACGKP